MHTEMFKKLNLDDFISSKASLILIPETITKLLHNLSQTGSQRKEQIEWQVHTTKRKTRVSVTGRGWVIKQ